MWPTGTMEDKGLAVFVDPQWSSSSFRLPQPLPEFVHIGQAIPRQGADPVRRPGRAFLHPGVESEPDAAAGGGSARGDGSRTGRACRHDSTTHCSWTAPIGANQVHSGGDFGIGKQAAVFHGQGGQPDARKDDLKLYFREVNQALVARPTTRANSVDRGGVDYLLPIFRETCDYAGLATDVR